MHLTGFGLSTAGQGTLANAIDISELGILVEAGAQLELGTEGSLSFFLPGAEQRIVVQGVVRVALDEVLLHYALEFNGGDDQCLGAIQNFIRQPAEY